jgi:hypothetical protein
MPFSIHTDNRYSNVSDAVKKDIVDYVSTILSQPQVEINRIKIINNYQDEDIILDEKDEFVFVKTKTENSKIYLPKIGKYQGVQIVVTNLTGKSLDLYTIDGDLFNNGKNKQIIPTKFNLKFISYMPHVWHHI